MTTQEIAQKLVEYCRKEDYERAQKELFAKDAVSIEPDEFPGFEKETRGLDAILEKGRKFQSITEELYGTTVSEPTVVGNVISFVMDMDIKMKGRERSKGGELCVYQVKDSKIVSEQFFM